MRCTSSRIGSRNPGMLIHIHHAMATLRGGPVTAKPHSHGPENYLFTAMKSLHSDEIAPTLSQSGATGAGAAGSAAGRHVDARLTLRYSTHRGLGQRSPSFSTVASAQMCQSPTKVECAKPRGVAGRCLLALCSCRALASYFPAAPSPAKRKSRANAVTVRARSCFEGRR